MIARRSRSRRAAGGLALGSEGRLDVLLDFAKKLTHLPESITPADYAPFQLAGLNQAAVTQAILIVVGFNLINRVADAFHFEARSTVEWTPCARLLLCFGYRHLAGPQLPFRGTPWMRVAACAHSKPGDAGITALVDSTARWLAFLVRLGSQVRQTGPDATTRVWRKVLYDPATITLDDVTTLERHGCTQADVFKLVLGAASAAALLRLDAGLRAISVCRPIGGNGHTSRQMSDASFNERVPNDDSLSALSS